MLFRFGPNVAVSFRWTLVGGLVFALGWVLATALFGIYVANFANYANTYGALGGVVVLMLWFYLTALLLLVAAEVTSVLARPTSPRRSTPAEPRRAPRGAARDSSAPVRSRRRPRDDAASDEPVSGLPIARRPARRPPLPSRCPLALAEPALVVAREAAGAVTGADARPRMSVGKRAGAFAMLGVAAVVGAIAGLLGGDDDKGATA